MKFRIFFSRSDTAPRTERDWEDYGIAAPQPDIADGWSAEGNAGDFILDMRAGGWTFLRLSPEP